MYFVFDNNPIGRETNLPEGIFETYRTFSKTLHL